MFTEIKVEELLASLPPIKENIIKLIDLSPEEVSRKIVVLDDDPTGTQTVHNVPVVTQWDKELLTDMMKREGKIFYILTNSRSLTIEEAKKINTEIAANLCKVTAELGIDFDIISRSDSTLRGHYPLEIDTLRNVIETRRGIKFDGEFIIPFFLEGGRYTVHDIHWVKDNDRLIPAGNTEYARDSAFGYKSSNLSEWVEEKTEGKFQADSVVSISLDDLRNGGPSRVQEIIKSIKQYTPIIVNATCYNDLRIFTRAVNELEKQGKRFLYRTAASFVKIKAGITDRVLLDEEELSTVKEKGAFTGGLVIVGSHVKKSTDQLEALLKEDQILGIEIAVKKLLKEETREDEINRVIIQMNKQLEKRNTVVYTSRELIKVDKPDSNLLISQSVSNALVKIVRGLKKKPSFIIAKGGITSSDIATQGLLIKEALVLGQISAGIPVWEAGKESMFPGMPYVIFPGNVGNINTLKIIYQKIKIKSE